MLYAHSRDEAGERHLLDDHLRAVATLAERFAAPFGGGEFARAAGWLHDIGKASREFQAYLAACEREPDRRHKTVDHKGAGTRAGIGLEENLAFLIQGHHGGLPDQSELRTKLKELNTRPDLPALLELARTQGWIPELNGAQAYPDHVTDRIRLEFFLRMCFSALVDADHLDTERHFTPQRAAERGGVPDLDTLARELADAQARLPRSANPTVQGVRDDIETACKEAAELPPGFFRLTAPTGGGKTRSGLVFAVQHALAHGLGRVIVAVPYLTITDQTVAVYRSIFADQRAVLEHYSSAGMGEDGTGEQSARAIWRRLATQDWDAPIVVTTQVQLLESLLGASTAACRKLHRIANSVIVLDEAQTLPAPLLTPVLDVLSRLTADYGASVVFCTATQPAFANAPGFEALAGVREIVPDAPRHFRLLKRVRYDWRHREAWDWERTAAEMHTAPSALAILNTKKDAQALLDALGDREALHLSTLLCPAHRLDILADVRRRLSAGEPCLLVATQVVEAGVDLDFPLVLRALGPLDRIVQAAGRCNREGRLEDGRVVVFKPAEGGLPPGPYKTATDETEALLARGEPDPDDPALFDRYFRTLFGTLDLDASRIQSVRRDFQYQQVAEKFKLIPDNTTTVIIRVDKNWPGSRGVDHATRSEAVLADLLEALKNPKLSRLGPLLKRARPYAISLYDRAFQEVKARGLVSELAGDVWEWKGRYDPVRGLVAEFDLDRTVV